MKKIKKRGAIYGVIALLLSAGIYWNWSYVGTPEELLASRQTDSAAQTEMESTPTIEQQDFFASSRLTREQARDEAISILKVTSESETADAQAKEDANAQISVLAENSVTEARVESLIRAKGYEDAVVMIGSDSVNIVVDAPDAGFEAADASVIRDIVIAETSIAADKIRIVEAD